MNDLLCEMFRKIDIDWYVLKYSVTLTLHTQLLIKAFFVIELPNILPVIYAESGTIIIDTGYSGASGNKLWK